MGSTSKRGLRYPESTVLANTLHTQIKNLAEDTDTALDYTALGGFQQVQNLCAFQESAPSLPGYIVIQTNQTFTNVMTKLSVKGHVYESASNVIDFDLTYYTYSATGNFVNYEYVNKGSYRAGYVGLWTRNSDGKVAIIIGAPQEQSYLWSYPRLIVDGHFGHTVMPATTYTSGWSVSRILEAGLSSYTRKIDLTPVFGAADDTGWKTMSLQTGYTNYSSGGGGFAQAAYRRRGGIVYLQGLVVSTGAVGSLITTMPAGFRPTNSGSRVNNCIAGAGSGVCRVDLNGDGTLVNQGGATPWLSLEQIRYIADA